MNIPATLYRVGYEPLESTFGPVSNELSEKWEEVDKVGLRFTLEVLPTRQLSICLEDYSRGDYMIKIVSGYSEKDVVSPVAEEFLTNFNSTDYNEWRERMDSGESE